MLGGLRRVEKSHRVGAVAGAAGALGLVEQRKKRLLRQFGQPLRQRLAGQDAVAKQAPKQQVGHRNQVPGAARLARPSAAKPNSESGVSGKSLGMTNE